METLAPVELSAEAMRRVVEREGGCVVWGGSVGLSPVDDLLIRVERALDIDSTGQLVASVLSKKAAAGSTHVVVDIPVGPSAKIRDRQAATSLAHLLERTGRELGLRVRAVLTDGSRPVGRGIGPALEARDVVAVARGERGAPADLRSRAIDLAAEVLELARHCAIGEGREQAAAALDDGRAWRKLVAICEAQGGLREPPRAPYRHPVVATTRGVLTRFDNRGLARVAKLAGAPSAKAAGVELHSSIGAAVEPGELLFEIHAETPGELEYARSYLDAHPDVLRVERLS